MEVGEGDSHGKVGGESAIRGGDRVSRGGDTGLAVAEAADYGGAFKMNEFAVLNVSP